MCNPLNINGNYSWNQSQCIISTSLYMFKRSPSPREFGGLPRNNIEHIQQLCLNEWCWCAIIRYIPEQRRPNTVYHIYARASFDWIDARPTGDNMEMITLCVCGVAWVCDKSNTCRSYSHSCVLYTLCVCFVCVCIFACSIRFKKKTLCTGIWPRQYYSVYTYISG